MLLNAQIEVTYHKLHFVALSIGKWINKTTTAGAGGGQSHSKDPRSTARHYAKFILFILYVTRENFCTRHCGISGAAGLTSDMTKVDNVMKI